MRRSSALRAIALSLLVGCGGAAPATRAAPPMRAAADETETTERDASPASEELVLLEGRLSATLPAGSPLTASEDWATRGPTFDAYAFEREGCSLALTVQSVGRMRPATLQPEGAERWLDPAPEGLAIFVMPERTYTTLSDEIPAVGAVLFEEDGTATDLWVAPQLPSGAEPITPGDDEEWVDAQRRDPRLANCFGVAAQWLDALLPTLRALAPFASPDELAFGWDETREEQARYRASLPPDWVLTTLPAYDAEFVYLHRRLPWMRHLGEPTPSVQLWMFIGDEAPRGRGRARQVLGRALRFDADGCAGFELGDGVATQHLCVTGSRAERAELLEMLETFRPVSLSPPE